MEINKKKKEAHIQPVTSVVIPQNVSGDDWFPDAQMISWTGA